MKLTRTVRLSGTPKFRDALKKEIERMGIDELPLRQALHGGNFLLDEKPVVMVNGVDELQDTIVARVGLFFAGIDAGSCCANDPSPVQPHHEYCVIQLEIERATGETCITLLDS